MSRTLFATAALAGLAAGQLTGGATVGASASAAVRACLSKTAGAACTVSNTDGMCLPTDGDLLSCRAVREDVLACRGKAAAAACSYTGSLGVSVTGQCQDVAALSTTACVSAAGESACDGKAEFATCTVSDRAGVCRKGLLQQLTCRALDATEVACSDKTLGASCQLGSGNDSQMRSCEQPSGGGPLACAVVTQVSACARAAAGDACQWHNGRGVCADSAQGRYCREQRAEEAACRNSTGTARCTYSDGGETRVGRCGTDPRTSVRWCFALPPVADACYGKQGGANCSYATVNGTCMNTTVSSSVALSVRLAVEAWTAAGGSVGGLLAGVSGQGNGNAQANGQASASLTVLTCRADERQQATDDAAARASSACPVVNGQECNGQGACETVSVKYRGTQLTRGTCRCNATHVQDGRCGVALADVKAATCGAATASAACSGNGQCVRAEGMSRREVAGVVEYQWNGRCECSSGYVGTVCQWAVTPAECPGNCSGRGTCESTGLFVRANASASANGNANANGNGNGVGGLVGGLTGGVSGSVGAVLSVKALGRCRCEAGYAGSACDVPVVAARCPQDCNGRGECVGLGVYSVNNTASGRVLVEKGACRCNATFYGPACQQELKECPAGLNNATCSGPSRGRCSRATGECTCACGFNGTACEAGATPTCPAAANGLACSGRGRCQCGTCNCAPGFEGPACETSIYKDCPAGNLTIGASASGSVGGAAGGAAGGLAASATVQVACSGRGSCDRLTGTCQCRYAWTGAACDEAKPRAQCDPACVTDQGFCDEVAGKCVCRAGYAGPTCATACPVDGAGRVCGGRGRCAWTGSAAECQCRQGWSGASCELQDCPADSSGLACSGHGACNRTSSGEAYCTCTDGWFGRRCGTSASAAAAVAASASARIAVRLEAAAEVRAERQQCKDANAPFLCPDNAAVAASLRGACAASLRACLAGSTSALSCPSGQQLCGLRCVDSAAECPAVRGCAAGHTRCCDGSCAADGAQCPACTASCPSSQPHLCADGITCRASEAECNAKTATWGCPLRRLACPGAPLRCVEAREQCDCPEGTRFCGFARASSGALLLAERVNASGSATLAPLPVCRAHCSRAQALGRAPCRAASTPVSASAGASVQLEADAELAAGLGLNLTAEGAASAGAARRLQQVAGEGRVGIVYAAPGAVTAAGGGDFSMAVSPVASSQALAGTAFGSLTTASSAVRVEFDTEVTIAAPFLQMELCLADEDAHGSAGACSAALGRVAPYFAADLTDTSAAASVAGSCSLGSACPCACAFTATAAGAYVLAEADASVRGEASASLSTSGAQAPGEYRWAAGAWSACDAECGGGVSVRAVACIDANGTEAERTRCDAQAEPEATATCNTQACPSDSFAWAVSPWGECQVPSGSQPCSDAVGTQDRSVQCVSQSGASASGAEAETRCGASKPAASRTCTDSCQLAGNGTDATTTAAPAGNGSATTTAEPTSGAARAALLPALLLLAAAQAA